MTLETAAVGAVGTLILMIFGWIWSRINNVQTDSLARTSKVYAEVQTRDAALRSDYKALKHDVEKLKVELPTNYATKEDLTILKSDILTEIRELRTLVKELITVNRS